MRASILDIQSPLHLPDVVAVAEAGGYTRYWVTEHYAPRQSASPTLGTALAGGVSERLRVGFGGVLLRLHAPLRVAADVGLLRSFFPDRIDVGIAGSPVSDEIAHALNGGVADDDLYRARIEELVHRLTDPQTPCAAFTDDLPQVWLCGTSVRTARLAGELGLRYAYHHHLMRSHGERPDVGAAYRDAFRPSTVTDAPYYAIAAYGSVAERGDVARIWSGTTEDTVRLPSFGGTAADCADQLQGLADRLGADEVFVDCFAPRLGDRLDALRALAEALDLGDQNSTDPEVAAEAH